MARTVDPVAYAARREAYADAAIQLIQTKGYQQLSIQAVIDEVGTSKGAFFHYFDSKAALLAAVVDRWVQFSIAAVTPIAADPGLSALEKLQGILSGIARWKSERPEFQPAAVAELMRTWYSEENAVVIERMRAAVAARLTPLLAEILRQGVADGSFAISDPGATASVFTTLMLGMQEVVIRLFLGRLDGTVSFEAVQGTMAAYAEAFERILGLPHLAWPLDDEATLRFWFDNPMPAKGHAA